jgi:outer membrane protein
MRIIMKTVLALALATLGWAALADGTKIAYVDYQRLVQESPQARAAQQALESEFAPKQKQLEAQKKELDGRAQKFERDQATMSESERTKTQRDLRDSQVTLERRAKEFQEDVQMRQNEELQRVQKMIVESVRTYAKAQGYDLVIAQGVIYNSDSIDITSAALSSLQSKAAAAVLAPSAAPAPTKK